MPLVDITLVEGRPPERIRTLIHEVHEAVRRALDAPGAAIRVVVREVPAEHWAAGDQTIAERRAAERQGPGDQGPGEQGPGEQGPGDQGQGDQGQGKQGQGR